MSVRVRPFDQAEADSTNRLWRLDRDLPRRHPRRGADDQDYLHRTLPTAYLSRVAAEGKIELLKQPAQDVDPSIVEQLEPGDLFFVDSSHTLGPTGEVSRIILEYLPGCGMACTPTFTIIWWPYDYTGNLLNNAVVFLARIDAFARFHDEQRTRACRMLAVAFASRRLGVFEDAFSLVLPPRQDHGLEKTPGHYPSSIYLSCVADMTDRPHATILYHYFHPDDVVSARHPL